MFQILPLWRSSGSFASGYIPGRGEGLLRFSAMSDDRARGAHDVRLGGGPPAGAGEPIGVWGGSSTIPHWRYLRCLEHACSCLSPSSSARLVSVAQAPPTPPRCCMESIRRTSSWASTAIRRGLSRASPSQAAGRRADRRTRPAPGEQAVARALEREPPLPDRRLHRRGDPGRHHPVRDCPRRRLVRLRFQPNRRPDPGHIGRSPESAAPSRHGSGRLRSPGVPLSATSRLTARGERTCSTCRSEATETAGSTPPCPISARSGKRSSTVGSCRRTGSVRWCAPAVRVPKESARYGLGFWLQLSNDTVMLEGCDAGVSFHTAHDPHAKVTYTVISNTSDGAWPIARYLAERLGT